MSGSCSGSDVQPAQRMQWPSSCYGSSRGLEADFSAGTICPDFGVAPVAPHVLTSKTARRLNLKRAIDEASSANLHD